MGLMSTSLDKPQPAEFSAHFRSKNVWITWNSPLWRLSPPKSSGTVDVLTRGANWRSSLALFSVEVEIEGARRYTLTNGPTKEIPVSDVPTPDTVAEAPQSESSEINLDAAGLSHTLRILEGMAAEGKPWFERATDPPATSAFEPPETDTSSDTRATSPERHDTARHERSAHPFPGRVAPVP